MSRRSYIVANHNLPSTYNELEYVSTNGGAGFSIASYTYNYAGYEVTVRFPSTVESVESYILGGINARSSYNVRFLLSRPASGATNAGKVMVDYNKTASANQTYDCSYTNNNTFQTCKLISTTLTKFSGSTASAASRYTGMASMAIGIGQRQGSSDLSSNAVHFDIKYIALYNNTTKTHELIPAKRKSDGVVGLYDKTTSTFYSSTTGVAFAAGPVIW